MTVDLAIASLIVNEYQADFRETAVAKIERVLNQSDCVLQLKNDSVSKEKYLKSVINSVTSESRDEEA